MLMNTLAMKYLPCDSNNAHSPKLVQNAVTHVTATNTRSAPTTPSTPLNGFSNNRATGFNASNSNTDMSITSYRYMEKYGLL